MNPIEVAVSPLRKDAMDRAETEARFDIQVAEQDLKDNGFDLNAAAPYPLTMFGNARMEASSKHEFYRSITKEDPKAGPQPGTIHGPYLVRMDRDKCKKLIAARRAAAAASYDAFIAKLVAKIGPVKSATLEGNHVWADSTLTVESLTTGGLQRWHTKMIVNRSKFHRTFFQWPTRKVKEKVA